MPTRLVTMIGEVKKEAANLKKHATKEELSLLDLTTFNAVNPSHCIYGQMTRHCYSERANELIVLCCEKIYQMPQDENDNTGIDSYKLISGESAGELKRIDESRSSYHSPIELFIMHDENIENGNNNRLIDYLKGHTEKLILKS